MCGIYGYVTSHKIDADVLRAMGNSLRHRGPDDGGETVLEAPNASIALGHKRLTIVDLSTAGRQPMCNEDESVWITCNGEIYNHRELRRDLQRRGHSFRSQCDTEVVVHLYEEMGTACLERLDGMFAFALWDAKQKQLLLARDRMGKKPLHYCNAAGHFVFSSEIKALLKHPRVSRQLDVSALSKYLTFEYVPAPHSIFSAIKKLEPGHYLLYKNNSASIARYWDIPTEDDARAQKPESVYVEELRNLMERAVRKRLVADVPVGLFVSGGLDSALVAALAARARSRLECFSIGFEEPSFDESRYAIKVAGALGLIHHMKIFHARDMAGIVQDLPDILDEPLADPSVLPLYLLSHFARERIKVVLSGDGGDEVFAGYQTYQAHKLARYYNVLPQFLQDGLKTVAARLPVSHGYLSADFKIKQFLKGAGVASEIGFFLWRGAFSGAEKNQLLSPAVQDALRDHNEYEDIYRYINDSGLTKELERILYLAMKLYLQDNNLVTVDRASMAAGLEVRSPLLDRDVVEFSSRLPVSYKLRGFTTKYLLKKAARGLLPTEIIHRQKRGFGIPLAKWFAGELKEFMLDHLSQDRLQRQGIFHYPYVKQLIDEQLAMTHDHRERLWTLLVFESWYDRYLDSGGRRCG
jgi:asparagine synthase (glutamine-hydrolysing)